MYKWLVFLYISLGLTDLIQSIYGIYGRGFGEINPIADGLLDRFVLFVLFKILGTTAVALLLTLLHREAKEYKFIDVSYLAVIVALVIQGFVVVSNFLVIYLER